MLSNPAYGMYWRTGEAASTPRLCSQLPAIAGTARSGWEVMRYPAGSYTLRKAGPAHIYDPDVVWPLRLLPLLGQP